MKCGPQDLLLSIGTIVTLLLVGTRASAQAAPTATGPGASIAAGGGASLFDSSYGQRNLGGAFVFADIQPHWRFGLELEARYLRVHTSEEISEKNYLAGPRVLLRSHRWQPYAKFLVGDGHIEFPFHYGEGNFLALVPGAGLDLEMNDYINIRVIDIEYQTLARVSVWERESLWDRRGTQLSTDSHRAISQRVQAQALSAQSPWASLRPVERPMQPESVSSVWPFCTRISG